MQTSVPPSPARMEHSALMVLVPINVFAQTVFMDRTAIKVSKREHKIPNHLSILRKSLCKQCSLSFLGKTEIIVYFDKNIIPFF